MKYKHRPIIVDAVQWDGTKESTREVAELGCYVSVVFHSKPGDIVNEDTIPSYMHIHDIDIDMYNDKSKVKVGDYIVKIKDRYEIYTEKEFKQKWWKLGE